MSARLNLHHLFLGILNDFAALRVPTEIAINGAFCAPHQLFGAHMKSESKTQSIRSRETQFFLVSQDAPVTTVHL